MFPDGQQRLAVPPIANLEGTAFPTWAGNTALTGHVYLADGTPGPFVKLNSLEWGDEIYIYAWGARYTYRVQSVEYVAPGDLSVLGHEDYDALTLITCQCYDEGGAGGEIRVRGGM